MSKFCVPPFLIKCKNHQTKFYSALKNLFKMSDKSNAEATLGPQPEQIAESVLAMGKAMPVTALLMSTLPSGQTARRHEQFGATNSNTCERKSSVQSEKEYPPLYFRISDEEESTTSTSSSSSSSSSDSDSSDSESESAIGNTKCKPR